MKIYIDELIALIIVVGSIVLLCLGINSEVKAILGVSAGWTFGGQWAMHRRMTGPK